jgi:hypothetical protein
MPLGERVLKYLAFIDLVLFSEMVELLLAGILVMFTPVWFMHISEALHALNVISTYHICWLYLENWDLFHNYLDWFFLDLFLKLRAFGNVFFEAMISQVILDLFIGAYATLRRGCLWGRRCFYQDFWEQFWVDTTYGKLWLWVRLLSIWEILWSKLDVGDL